MKIKMYELIYCKLTSATVQGCNSNDTFQENKALISPNMLMDFKQKVIICVMKYIFCGGKLL